MQDSLSSAGFTAISDFFFQHSGIRLKREKYALVEGRLRRRATAQGLDTLDEYVDHVLAAPQSAEALGVVDALTTNETYFLREPAHFEHLTQVAREASGSRPLRVWSAAASSGEEGYSIAMTLARHAGSHPWEVVGTDLSSVVVAKARQGLYPAERCTNIPLPDLKLWCLRGEGRYEGQVLINRELRSKVKFEIGNLMHPMPSLGQFDVIFLRNVLIYFEGEAKARLISNVLSHLRPGGHFYIGHTESLHGMEHMLQRIAPAIFRRPA